MTDGFEPVLRVARDAALEYLDGVDARPVMPDDGTVANLAAFDEPLPDTGSEPEEILRQLHRYGSPATVLSGSGRYFGFVAGGVLPAALAANWLVGAWDQNAGFRIMSPVASTLEDVVARWLLELFDLPPDTAVGFVTGSTMGSFSALAAARAHLCRRHGHDVRRLGLRTAPPIRVVAAAEIHPANLRALTYLGWGRDEIETVPTDAQGRLRIDDLPTLDDRTVVLVQAGNVNTGSFDAIPDIAERARAAGAWVHVDGAFGLWARASEAHKHLAAGIERADSWNTDGHKWLNVPYDAGVYGCRHPVAVYDAFGVEAPYLVRTEHREPNYFTPELARRPRGVEFWAAIKNLGREGIERLVDRCCDDARRYAHALEELGFEILNEVVLNQVLFRHPDDERTQHVLDAVQRRGEIWIGPTRWRDRLALRLSFCTWRSGEDDFRRTMSAIRAVLGVQP